MKTRRERPEAFVPFSENREDCGTRLFDRTEKMKQGDDRFLTFGGTSIS